MTDIRIDRLALDGDGIGRLSNGQAAFVPYALPGETVKGKLLLQKKNHSRWIPEKILTASKDRVEPKCRFHFKPGGGMPCGGCNWQNMPTSIQESAKRQLVIETLERLGGIANPPVQPTIRSPQDWRYRNKVQVPFGRRGKYIIAGFFAPGSHDIVDIDDCLVQPPLSVDILKFVKEYANAVPWAPYNEDKGHGWIRHLLIRTNEAGQALVTLVTNNETFRDQAAFVSVMRKKFPAVIGIHQNIQRARTHVILGRDWKNLWGADIIVEQVLGLKISCSAGSFFQVNKPAADLLYKKTLEELGARKDEAVLDIYCGGGALTLAAAKSAAFAYGIESHPTSIRDAKRNAQQNNVRNVEFIEGEAERLLPNFDSEGRLLVILDPPRSGCDPRVLEALMKLQPVRIVYVSCHPATLARDVKILSPKYQVASATPVDLFPQTSHIETVCRLERR